MKYQIIYADPGWQYNDPAGAGKRGAQFKYTVTALEALKQLRVSEIAAEDCLLAMWWVPPMPKEAIELAEAWGFKLKTMKGFTWHKLTRNGKDHFGMGHWTRANTEDCLFASRGNPPRKSHSVRQLVHSVIREPARKPDEIRDMLVELIGDVPRIELFARQRFCGWDAWGDEIKSDVEL